MIPFLYPAWLWATVGSCARSLATACDACVSLLGANGETVGAVAP